MKARVHWETRHTSGHMDWEDWQTDFREWCDSLTEAIVHAHGHGFLASSTHAVAYKNIVRIEKLED